VTDFTRIMRQATLVDAEVKGRLFRGYAAVFDTPWDDRLTEDMGYVEKVAHGAFRKALALKENVPFLLGHERNMLLATTKAGNLRLREEPRGLLTEAKLPDNHLGEYARSMVDSGDIQGMSYGIALDPRRDVLRSESNGVVTRTIANARRLLDVSLTWEPAYSATTVELRSQGFVAIPVQEPVGGEETQPNASGTDDQPPDEADDAWWVERPADAVAADVTRPWWETYADELERRF